MTERRTQKRIRIRTASSLHLEVLGRVLVLSVVAASLMGVLGIAADTTIVALTIDPSSICAGGVVECRARVTNTADETPNGAPVGSVNFTSDGAGYFDTNPVGLTAITDTYSECKAYYHPTSAAGSPHTITATYWTNDDTKWVGNTFKTADVTVTWCVDVNVMGSETPLVVKDWTWVTATVVETTGAGPIPTGSINFSRVNADDDGTFFDGTGCTLDAAGVCMVKYRADSIDTGGIHELQADFNGSGSYGSSDKSGTYAQHVTRRAVEIAMDLSPTAVYVLGTVTIKIHVEDDTTVGTPPSLNGVEITLDNGSATGTFSDETPTLNSSGNCTVTYTPEEDGTHTITATFTESNVYMGKVVSGAVIADLRPTLTTVEFEAPEGIMVTDETWFTVTVKDTANDGADNVNPQGDIDLTYEVDGGSGEGRDVEPVVGWPQDVGEDTRKWKYNYKWTELHPDADRGAIYDIVTADYRATGDSDGVHLDSADQDNYGKYGKSVSLRPTELTVTCGGAEGAWNGMVTATVAEPTENTGSDQVIFGDFVTVHVNAAGDMVETYAADAPGPVSITIETDSKVPAAAPMIKYTPSDNIHMASVGAPDGPCVRSVTGNDGDPSTGHGCTAGCGSGGSDVYQLILDQNEMITGFTALKIALDVASIVTSLIPDPVWTAGIIFASGTEIPAKEIVAAIFDTFNNVILAAAITALESDLDGDGLPDLIENNVTNTNKSKVDTDADAMDDAGEVGYSAGFAGGNLRPDPNNPDSDYDGLLDGYELAPFATNVCVDDSDCDTVPDGVEIATTSEPGIDNGNGFFIVAIDGVTSYSPTWPLASYSGYTFSDDFADVRDQCDPREGDTDGDGLDDGVEFGPGVILKLGVDHATDGPYHPYVNDADSDGDGILDGNESTNGDAIWDYTSIGGTGTEPASIGEGETHLCFADTDEDGLLDGEEEALFGRGPTTVVTPWGTVTTPALDDDSDDDGLSDYEEQVVTGTDPLDFDSDNDGLRDPWELIVTSGNFPTRSFYQESDPLDPDTDDDGIRDDVEYNDGAGSGVGREYGDTSGNYGDPDIDCPYVNDGDSDDDGLQDGWEDRNRDGVWDYADDDLGDHETHALLTYGGTASETDPCDRDTDGDGLTDGEEEGLFGLVVEPEGVSASVGALGGTITWNLKTTTIPALDIDMDNDGLRDDEEVNVYNTDPMDADSDDDTLGDGIEVATWEAEIYTRLASTLGWTLPFGGVTAKSEDERDHADPNMQDTDGDGLTDNLEIAFGCTYVNDDDSDDDGLQDGWEDRNRDGDWDFDYTSLGHSSSSAPLTYSGTASETNPCDCDTDHDGLLDGEEEGQLGTTMTFQEVSLTVGLAGPTTQQTIAALDDDIDNDGLSDYEEVNVTNTYPADADSDDDKISDANELIATSQGTWPVVPSGPAAAAGAGFFVRTFYQESDPLDPDTDDDELTDDIEYFRDNDAGDDLYDGTDLGIRRTTWGRPDVTCPYVNDDDSDDDGLQDGTEDANHDGTWGVAGAHTDPGSFGTQATPNGDGYYETDLCNPDTDGDGLLDGEEVGQLGGEPTMPSRPYLRATPGFVEVTPEAVSTELPEGTTDPTTLVESYVYALPSPGTQGTNIAPYVFTPKPGDVYAVTIPALDVDSDDDGLSDYEEVNITGTDPLDQDSDNDTLMDADELIATGGVTGLTPRRTFDQESDPLDINTDDDHLFDPQEYAGSGLSTAVGAVSPAGSRDAACPMVNDDDSDGDGIQDGAVVAITPKGVITFGGAQYSYTHYEDFIDLDERDEEHPGVVRTVATSGYGEQQDDGDWDVCDYDSDGDGLNDGEEIAIGTNPNDWDTDDDGRNDWHEVTGGGPIPTDPFDPDTDDDGLLDSAEVFGSNTTNPANADTDGDGLCDGGAGTPWMYSNDARVVVNPLCKSCATWGLDPCGALTERWGSLSGIGDHPNLRGFGEDQNGDGIWDADETDPNQYDTDGDAIADGIERLAFSTSRQYMIPTKDLLGRDILVEYPNANNLQNPNPCCCLNPLNPDSDGDGLSDGYEDANHDGNFDFLPSDFDIFESSVETSLPDPEETNPCDADSDRDGLTDWEERYQRQPLAVNPAAAVVPIDNDGDGLVDEDPVDGIDNDLDGKFDEDGPENIVELTFNPTNPLDHDTDNDWLTDGYEVFYACVRIEYTQLDNDTDGYINEDEIDGLDNDGDGLFDEDPRDFDVRFVSMLDPTNRDSDSDGYIDGLDEDPCNSEMIPLVEIPVLLPVDSDGDGFADDDEEVAGTHPNDPEDYPAAYCAVDVDFDDFIDDRIWLDPGLCCGEASAVVIDLDSNLLIDLRVAITTKSLKKGDFDGDGYEDDIRYIVEYILSNYRAVQLRGIATIDDYNSDLVIDWVVVERK